MIKRRAVHDSFTTERVYDAAPARVFAAWASLEARARWFTGPAERWTTNDRGLEFRVGGREWLKGTFKDGQTSTFESVYQDIVPNERIVFSYAMQKDGVPISVSLGTVELAAAGKGTRLRYTEQSAFLDDFEDGGGRERGTNALLDQLDAFLRG